MRIPFLSEGLLFHQVNYSHWRAYVLIHLKTNNYV